MANETKQEFKQFVEDFNLERFENKHAVIIDGNVYGYQRVKDNKIDCRQFYEMYDGIIYKHGNNYSIVHVDHSSLDDLPVTRIDTKGRKAYNMIIYLT